MESCGGAFCELEGYVRIKKIRVRNYRSIRSEANIDFDSLAVVVGPNNSGKTNLLRAISLFFEAARNNTYSVEDDLPFGVSGELTSIIVTFSASESEDADFLKKYQELSDFLEGDKESSAGSISLYLSFSAVGRPSYKFFVNDKVKVGRRDEYRRAQEELALELLDGFSCKYVPSEKSAAKLFEDFLIPHLRVHIGELLQDQEAKIYKALSGVSESITKNLQRSGLSETKCALELPKHKFSKALSKFDFFIDDGEKTHFYRKGSGVQAAAVLACFQWISLQEQDRGKNVIWLIEEPESYLHPGLTESCRKIIKELSTVSAVFSTTHSIGFVPVDHREVLQTGFSKGVGTIFSVPTNYAEATDSIRSALGIRFSDFYHLTEYNVFVEGKTDKLLIEHMLSVIRPGKTANKYEALRSASIIDFTGTSSLKDFLKSAYSFMAKERPIVVIFDGDEAGLKAINDLNGYFGKKQVAFSSNQEYLILPRRLPIEGLFPPEWLKELSEQHPKWLKIEWDALGNIAALNMAGDRKTAISQWLINKSIEVTNNNNGVYSWAKDFITIFDLADKILKKKSGQLQVRI